MVKFNTILQANAAFAKDTSQNTGLVCVFAGATSGSGAGTIERMAAMLQDSTFYVLGRSASRFAVQRKTLETLNSTLKIEFIETDVSLISGIDLASEQILAAEKKVDILYMSQGTYPLSAPIYTKEGLDTCFALSYYTRLRLASNLLPLLRASPRARVLSVLSGGREKELLETDLGLQDPRNYSSRTAVNQMTTLTTLALNHLSSNSENKKITFIHSFPGLVNTGNFSKLKAPESAGFLGRLFIAFLSTFVSTLQKLFGMSVLDCGARQAFLLTNEQFREGGVRLVNEKSEVVTNSVALEGYIRGGWGKRVWDFTVGVWQKALSGAGN